MSARLSGTALTIASLVLAAPLISGCSKPDPHKRLPGKWKTEIKLETIQVTGMDEAAVRPLRKQLEEQIAKEGKDDECLGIEEAQDEEQTFVKDLTDGMGQGSDCIFSKTRMSEGKIDVTGICKIEGKPMDAVISGDIHPKLVNALFTLKGDVQPGVQMVMQLKAEAKHVGTCL